MLGHEINAGGDLPPNKGEASDWHAFDRRTLLGQRAGPVALSHTAWTGLSGRSKPSPDHQENQCVRGRSTSTLPRTGGRDTYAL